MVEADGCCINEKSHLRGGGKTMGKNKDSIGDRMKKYEGIPRNFLTRRVPAIIRLDGKAFHTFTKGMQKPFDRVLMNAMQQTMKYLCENIQGCVLGYTQSDEITLVLTDYATIKTDAWFGYNVQKMASIAASMATLAFNKALYQAIDDYFNRGDVLSAMHSEDTEERAKVRKYADIMANAFRKGALFDARAFSVPKDEVCNCLIWRQQDATRNSIEAVGQANFSHRELQGKSCNDIQEMLWCQRNLNWNNFPADCKRGSCCFKVKQDAQMVDPKDPEKSITITRNKWVVDKDPPIFTQDRAYVERWL